MVIQDNRSPANGDRSNASGSSASAPAISLPKGGGAIRSIGEKFAANPVTGTGSMSIPLPLSPARSGFGPQLSLSYDSGAGNGPYGLGWHLSLPSITRKTDKGLPRYQDSASQQVLQDSDVFLLSASEDLVPVLKQDTNGDWLRDANGNFLIDESERDGYRIRRYRPRIEGLFARIERWTRQSDGDTYWRSISNGNITTFYGKTPESRIADPRAPNRIFSWLICASYDDKGNAMVFEYVGEDDRNVDLTQANEHNRVRSANRYLKRCTYGNHSPNRDTNGQVVDPAQLPASEWMFELVMDYGEGHYFELAPDAEGRQFVTAQRDVPPNGHWLARPDPFSAYRAGFEVRTHRLCQRALMFHHFPQELGIADCLVRAVEFEYDSGPIASFLTAVTQSGYVRQPGQTPNGYLKKSMPPGEFTYSKMPDAAQLAQLPPQDVAAESLENLPYGMDGAHYQWIDLDGEGLSGILTEQGDAWFYKRNLSPLNERTQNGETRISARLAPVEIVPVMPNASLSQGQAQFADLAGDGLPDLVTFSGPVPGFYEHDPAAGWQPFHLFESQPNVNLRDPNLKLIDLDGDGHADILITEGDALRWHPSLSENGFGPAIRVSVPSDEERGPRIVFADGTQSIYLADMSGDGLSALVRIRNGEVCYWPNLGYGHFGAKVTMDNAPRFDAPDEFDQSRIRLADIDGSGVTDVIYLGRDAVYLYFNESGNRWSAPVKLTQFPRIDDLSSVSAMDLLGNGTACLVWSSPLPGHSHRAMRYLDLMGGQKPHLLIKEVNNLGAETVMHYAPTTKFYLQDKHAGEPWLTKLPFPVHVVERLEIYDRISRNRFVTRYTYHHGYFDGAEREFRGFGMVEQLDTEEIGTLTTGTFPSGTNIDAASHVPPVLTHTWFHTGIYLGREHISDFYAGLKDANDVGEYYREPGLDDAQARELLLDDTLLPDGLTADEEREACRALKGTLLRQEIYALDGTAQAQHPYIVTEQNMTIRLVQPRGKNRSAVFLTQPHEVINYHYEREPNHPRIVHALTLAVDAFGNVLKSAAIAYGRRQPDPELDARDQARQSELFIRCTEGAFTNSVDADDDYRTPLPSESRGYELTGLALAPGKSRLTFAELLAAVNHATEIPFEQPPASGIMQKRLTDHTRIYYRRDDLTTPLPLGQAQSLALPFETYNLAFTPGLVTHIYGSRVQDSMLATECGYVHTEGDSNWWIPSGRIFYSPDAQATPLQELAQARAHFFLSRRLRDPFGTTLAIEYDAHDLLTTRTRDALGNETVAESDYRVLQPAIISDPNRNRARVAFDALGMVVGKAIMGKAQDNQGDSLEEFEPDLTDAVIAAHLQAPLADPHAILKHATTRLIYDVFAYQRTKDGPDPQPTVVYALVRETHASDLGPGMESRIQHGLTYADGFGREIQKKIQVEAGPLVPGGAEQNPRWVGSGWTIFNNKGKPVRQYEPFFSATPAFEFAAAFGVSPILFYDPMLRVVATHNPNHTYAKVCVDVWHQETWDVNDTVLQADPKNDPDAGAFFRLLPEHTYLPTWHAQREGGALGLEEQAAALKTRAHANTPTVTHLDSLGRPFLTITHNRLERNGTLVAEILKTRVELDIQGNPREVIDANERTIMRYDYDMLGNPVHQASMEAGERWMLNDIARKLIYAWDSREHEFHSTYDSLQRPLASYLRQGVGQALEITRTVYGESLPDPEARNLRGMIAQLFDQAGIITTDEYDFKGNLLRSQRQLAHNYKTILDWSASVPLESDTFISRTRFDALNRPTEITAPDDSVIRPLYNEANLLERLDVNLHGAPVLTPFVTSVAYDAEGQRSRIDYGNGVQTTYLYDPLTFRLNSLATRHAAGALQDLRYTYDPVGNITHIRDNAQQTFFFRNKRVEPSAEFTYDAIYQLIGAVGREHLGQTGGQANSPSAPDTFSSFHTRLDHPGNGDAMGTYAESYIYDAIGNLLSVQHRGSDPAHPGWTREYAYDEHSLLEPDKLNNRLSRTTLGSQNGQPLIEPYAYDAHGNMTQMPHLPLLLWDHRDQLHGTFRQVVNDGGTPETTYYVYDAAGQRVRKVTERQAAAGQTPTRKSERIYLGGVEIYREYANDGETLMLERETLHVMDESERIALVETRTQGSDPAPEQLIRYQFGNHLGSASLELDEQAQLITYEEYYPYGSTSYQAVRSQIDTPKRYRYTGKERDEETGLSYHGARYYAPWLGRWVSSDPQGIAGGGNLFAYASGNPVRLVDPSGMQPEGTVEVRIDETGVYHLPSSVGETVNISAEAPPPDKLELAIRNKLIHVLTVNEFENKLRWELKQGNSGYAASWTQMDISEYDWATDRERVAMSEAKWWDYVNKEYAGYRAGKAAEWDKSSRLMATYGKIGKGIGWGVVAAVGLFGGAAAAAPGSLLGGGTASSALAGGGGATTAATTGTGVVATAQVTTGKVMTTVATNTGAYVVASTVYGAVTPPGAPDLPGPMDNAGRALRNLGVASDEAGKIASGIQIWGKIERGQAEIAPYFKYEGGKLTAGILGMFSRSENVSQDMVKAYLVFRQQSTALAKALGAKTLRLEASTVINELEVPRMLKKLGFQEKPNDPFSFFLDIAVK